MWTIDILAVTAACLVTAVLERWGRNLGAWERTTILLGLWVVLMVFTSIWMRGVRPAYNAFEEIEGFVTGIGLALYLSAVYVAFLLGRRYGLSTIYRLILAGCFGFLAILLMRYAGFYVYTVVSMVFVAR
jgi:hypothetical protein